MSQDYWRRLLRLCLVGLVAVVGAAAIGFGQNAPVEPGPVVIRREPLRLTAPDVYRLPLQLEPMKQLIIAAPCDGTVQSVDVEVGKSVKGQELLVRIVATERQLMLDRSLAQQKVAELELEQAKKAGQGMELAEARLHAAQADVKLLQWQVEQLSARAPFAGTVLKLHVQVGQVVKFGEPLLTLADLTQLKVEMPVDRETVEEGGAFKLRVENQTVDAKVDKLLPADAKFERVRDLATSLATAVVMLDNSAGKRHVGQAAFGPLIPRYPVAEVMTTAVGTTEKGQRRVQVVRQGIVRDVDVDLLGQVGVERVFVSGAFVEGDVLILSSSRELADGTQLRHNPGAALPAPSAAATIAKPNEKPAAPEKKKTTSGF